MCSILQSQEYVQDSKKNCTRAGPNHWRSLGTQYNLYLLHYPSSNSISTATVLPNDLEHVTGVNIFIQTKRHRLLEGSLMAKCSGVGPVLTAQSCTGFNLSTCDSCERVWRCLGKCYSACNIIDRMTRLAMGQWQPGEAYPWKDTKSWAPWHSDFYGKSGWNPWSRS